MILPLPLMLSIEVEVAPPTQETTTPRSRWWIDKQG